MAVDIATLIIKIAPEVLKMYRKMEKSGELPTDFLPDDLSVQAGLTRLADLGFLTPEVAKRLAEFDDDWFSELKGIIKTFQEKDGLPPGETDGILGNQTIRLLTIASRCMGRLGKDRTGVTNSSPNARFNHNEVRYFIEEVPAVQGATARLLLESAWASWKRVANIMVSRTGKKSEANVIVRLVGIDGSGNVLADAHVGPPEGSAAGTEQLEIRFDVAETWDAFKFEATACHEIGHLLGLGHSSNASDLMAPKLQSVKQPQAGDITAMQGIWGPPPEFKDHVEPTPDSDIPTFPT